MGRAAVVDLENVFAVLIRLRQTGTLGHFANWYYIWPTLHTDKSSVMYNTESKENSMFRFAYF